MRTAEAAARASPAAAPRRRSSTAESWAGIAVLVISVGLAAPTLVGLVPTLLPHGWWVVLFGVFMAAMVTTAVVDGGRMRAVAYAVMVLSSWAVVMTATGGFILVLLVMVAALGAYVAPLCISLAVIGVNTAVVAATTWLTRGDATETLIQTGFYLLIQLATLGSSMALLQERETRRALTAAHVELRAATLERAESARTAERLRISRELHDAIGHHLTVLTLQLETAKHVEGEAAREHLERADGIARALLGDVRQTVGRLRVAAPDLERTLREMTAELPGLDVSVEVAPQIAVDDVERAALIRAAQEIVTNTIRHADASRLRLSITSDERGVVLTGHDDGRGAATVRLGNGLLGLQERFAELGGEVRVDGRSGFAVTARVPSA